MRFSSVQFLSERISLGRYCNQEQLDLFELFFARILSLSVGGSVQPINTFLAPASKQTREFGTIT